jgi:phosphoribosylglycinamide formyltransferase-1
VPGSSSSQLAVFASGRGTNFEALARASERGALGGHIVLLCCDDPEAGALSRAQRLGIEALCLPTGRFRTRIEDESVWRAALEERGIDVVLLAGFMRRLHGTLLGAFPDRILNIHPSLLPAFPGLDAIGRAFASRVRTSGCTVHLVDADLDTGPIIAQRAVERREDDTLQTFEARIHEAEHAAYPRAVRRYLTGPWQRVGEKLVWSRSPAEVNGD